MNPSVPSRPRFASRRDFLRRSTVGATAAWGLSLARSAHAAGGESIRIGMIGCGGRCTGAAGNAMTADPSVKLVAMCDLFADRVKYSRKLLQTQFAEQVSIDDDHCFVGLDGYKHVIDAADVVLIACAAKFHPMYLKAGIEAGKHVFVEKPHAIDPLGIKVLNEAVALAKKKQRGILSGLQSRFHAAIRETVRRVLDGQIGDVVAIQETWLRGPYGATRRPQGYREIEVQYGNQYRFSWLCGDDVPQTLVHNLDRATWAMGEAVPVKCYGMGGRSSSQMLLGDVFDHNSVVYQYASGVRLYAICRTTLNCYDENSSLIMGTKGTALPLSGRITGENAWKFPDKVADPYVNEHKEFIASIRDGKPLNCGEYMSRSTMVGIMGQMSCYSGKEVTWEQVTNSDYCLGPRPEDCTWEMDPPTKPDAEGVYPVCATPGLTKNVWHFRDLGGAK